MVLYLQTKNPECNEELHDSTDSLKKTGDFSHGKWKRCYLGMLGSIGEKWDLSKLMTRDETCKSGPQGQFVQGLRIYAEDGAPCSIGLNWFG